MQVLVCHSSTLGAFGGQPRVFLQVDIWRAVLHLLGE